MTATEQTKLKAFPLFRLYTSLPTPPLLTFLKAGAILLVSVPATIITSLCLGLALKTIPNLSISYLLAAECIISTAQHARPNVMGQREPLRAQFTRSSTRETVYSTLLETGEPVSMGSIDDTWVTWSWGVGGVKVGVAVGMVVCGGGLE